MKTKKKKKWKPSKDPKVQLRTMRKVFKAMTEDIDEHGLKYCRCSISVHLARVALGMKSEEPVNPLANEY